MLRLTFLISLLKLIQSTSMRPGFLGLEIIMSKVEDRIKIKVLFPVLELNFGTQFPTNYGSFKKHVHDLLLSIMETEDGYVEAPILLQKIARSAATT